MQDRSCAWALKHELEKEYHDKKRLGYINQLLE